MYRPTAPLKANATTATEYLGEAIGPGTALPFPTEAIVDATNEPITLLTICDWRGHSPSLVSVDRAGKFLIAAFGEVTATDARVLPNELGYTIRSRRLTKAEKAGKKMP